jgi:hypothetical protein
VLKNVLPQLRRRLHAASQPTGAQP